MASWLTLRLQRHAVHLVPIVAALALVLWRYTVGMGSWGDEAYGLSTALRYVYGDRPLVDSWDTNFSSAILAIPFVKAFLAVTGSTDGILLGFRAVFLLLVMATALMTWIALKDLLDRRLAFVLAVLALVYLPYLSPFVGYGGHWLWHILAALAAIRLHASPPRLAVAQALPGILSGLAIIGNPPTLIVVPFFVLALWLSWRRSPEARPVRWYLLGLAAVGAKSMVVLAILAGPEALTMLSHVAQPDDHDFGAPALIMRLWQGRWLIALPIAATAGSVLVRCASSWARTHIDSIALLVGLALTIPAIVTERIPTLIAPQALVFIPGLTLLCIRFTSRTTWTCTDRLLFLLPAVGAGIGWFLGSNGGLGTAILAAPLVLSAAFRQPEVGVPKRAETTTVAALALLVVAVAAAGATFSPEGVTFTMTERAKAGPFWGVAGTASEVSDYEEVVAILQGLKPIEGRIVFIERFPLGYLVVPNRPGTYSTWATSATSGRLENYVSLTGNKPSRIIFTRLSAGLEDGEFSRGLSLVGFPQDYELVQQNEHFVIYDFARAGGG